MSSNGKEKTPPTIGDMLVAKKDFLSKVLPKHLTPERIIKVALFARSKSPALLQCSNESLLKAILECAQLGLEPSGPWGGWLVPFNNKRGGREATLIVDYRAMMEIARQAAGDIRSIEARVAHEGDEFKVTLGLRPDIVHVPKFGGQGEPIAFYAVATFKDGSTQFEVMTREEVEKIKARSRAKDSGPWLTDFEAMGKKTVIKQLCKWLPHNDRLARAIATDDSHEEGEQAFIDLELPEDVVPEPVSKTEQVKNQLKASSPSQAVPSVPPGADISQTRERILIQDEPGSAG
jgi:recombination protein RecT